MIAFPNSKINIGLNVVGRRDDGYHDIETLFYPVGWCDALEIVVTPKVNSSKNAGVTFTQSGMIIPGMSDQNICLKAFALLADYFDAAQIQMHLHKSIPTQAGLGGGSSDGVAVLKLLNEVGKLGLGNAELLTMAAKLGSDCSFFVQGEPAFARGRGEELSSAPRVLEGLYVLIVKPKESISTKAAFTSITPCKPNKELSLLVKEPIENWKQTITNDFEAFAFRQFPNMEKIKQALYDQGAIYASMTGSGSAFYGVFKNPINKLKGYEHLSQWAGSL